MEDQRIEDSHFPIASSISGKKGPSYHILEVNDLKYMNRRQNSAVTFAWPPSVDIFTLDTTNVSHNFSLRPKIYRLVSSMPHFVDMLKFVSLSEAQCHVVFLATTLLQAKSMPKRAPTQGAELSRSNSRERPTPHRSPHSSQTIPPLPLVWFFTCGCCLLPRRSTSQHRRPIHAVSAGQKLPPDPENGRRD